MCFRVTIVAQPRLKFIQCPEPLGLAHLTVNGDGPETKVAQHEGNAPGVVAGACEQHHRTAGQLREHICQIAVLCATTFAVNTGGECSSGFAQVLAGDVKGNLMRVRQRSARLAAPCLRTRSSRCAAGGEAQGDTLCLAGMKRYCWRSVSTVEYLEVTSTFTGFLRQALCSLATCSSNHGSSCNATPAAITL